PSSSLFSLSKAHPGQTYRFSLLRLHFLPASNGRLPHLAPSLRLPGFPSRTVAPSFPLFCQKVPLYWSKLRKKKKGCSPPRCDVFRKQPSFRSYSMYTGCSAAAWLPFTAGSCCRQEKQVIRGAGRRPRSFSSHRSRRADVQNNGGGIGHREGGGTAAEGDGQVVPQAVSTQVHHKALSLSRNACQIAQSNRGRALAGNSHAADLTGTVLVDAGFAQFSLDRFGQAVPQQTQLLLGALCTLDGLVDLGRLTVFAGLGLGGVGHIAALGLSAAVGAAYSCPGGHRQGCDQRSGGHDGKDLLFHAKNLHYFLV